MLLINVKNHQKYSDSIILNVIDLPHIDLATENESLQEASETIFRMSVEDLVRKRCRDRKEYYQHLQNYELNFAEIETLKQQKKQRSNL